MKKLFNKKKDSKRDLDEGSSSPPKREELKLKRKLNLPKNFAKKVIDLENVCDRPDVTMKLVKELMDLYTAAIEYYNSISDNDSQRFYQNKLHALIGRIDVQFLSTSPGQNQASNRYSQRVGQTQKLLSAQEMRERQIEKKRVQDAIQLGIYNATKVNEEVKEKLLDDMIRNEQESIKTIQNDLLNQKESFLKKLNEKRKAKERSQSLNNSLSFNFNGMRGETQQQQSKQSQHPMSKLPSPRSGGPLFGISRIGKDQSYFSSGGRSVHSGGASLANKIQNAFSRVMNRESVNIDQPEDEEDIDDLIFLVSELNQNEDLNVKLNNHSKICKILETPNDDSPTTNPAAAKIKPRQTLFDAQFKEIMENCKKQLQEILEQREKAIEEFLEQYAEEKFRETQEIKKKFQINLNYFAKSKNPNKEEKIKSEEEKREQEIAALQDELAKKKKETLDEIKLKFNQMAKKVQIDQKALEQALRQKVAQSRGERQVHTGAVESPVKPDLETVLDQQLAGEPGSQSAKAPRKVSQGYIGALRQNQPNQQQ